MFTDLFTIAMAIGQNYRLAINLNKTLRHCLWWGGTDFIRDFHKNMLLALGT